MLYIHKLSDLNPKSAEIESVPFIRSIRLGAPFPLTEQRVREYFAETLAAENDIVFMERSMQLLEPTLAKLGELLLRNNPLYEPVNICRAIQSLKPLSGFLANNIIYAKEITAFQQEFMAKAASLLNSIPSLRTSEDKSRLNSEIGAYFERVLRSKEFRFSYQDLIHEAQTIMVSDLADCFRKGYVFHVTLEEEIRKAGFADIKARIPSDKLSEVEEIEKSIRLIKEGVDQAYSLNMRMVSWAVLFLSFVKSATAG
ncbi:hypothetical protein HYU17_03920 [Candidatus Woesearchaeota archaeon]|nr:hypothetical protein [Candidatus Woesearchaeota archaeon]